MSRSLARASILLLSLALAACGFQLRDALTLPTDLGAVRVEATDPYSALQQALSLSLERAGATLAAEGTQGVSRLQILTEQWASTPIAVDELGRAQEFSLRYAVVFKLARADGSDLVPQQVVELSRDYVSLPENSTGSESEREILARELQREMAASILRRIDAAARATSTPATPAAGSDSALPVVAPTGTPTRP
ncbi:MAG TPA: LPS assembly lipoprotein LptE [Luteimonas sp.]|nr:LPS assembly lipoprotein LptE [Luteimonas sp.]